MKIVVSGGTGFVGRALTAHLRARGDDVVVLTRSRALAEREPAESLPGTLSFAEWQPLAPEPGPELLAALEGASGVVHLAGEVLVGRRLTSALQKQAEQSRVNSTLALAAALGRLDRPPSVFVSGSAVGYYGDTDPDLPLIEASPAGDDFFARLCVAWEGATRATPPSVRVVHSRLGIVFGPHGGALEAMARPIKLMVGGRLGSGRQVVSWIHLEDAARALAFCLDTPALVGPVNLSAPNPVDNRELTDILGRVLHRPTFIPVPATALRLLLGKGAEPILTGQRVLPQKLLEAGFQFRFHSAEAAVAASVLASSSRS